MYTSLRGGVWGGPSPYCQKMRSGKMPHTCMQPCRHGRMGTDDERLICGLPTIKQRNRALGRTVKTVIADDAQCRVLHVHARKLRRGHYALINIIII